METPPSRDSSDGASVKGIYFIAVSQFGIAFSFNCIMSFMPFYILKVSAYEMKETMLWIGMIMGSTSMVAALAAPFWGSLTARVRPKLNCGPSLASREASQRKRCIATGCRSHRHSGPSWTAWRR